MISVVVGHVMAPATTPRLGWCLCSGDLWAGYRRTWATFQNQPKKCSSCLFYHVCYPRFSTAASGVMPINVLKISDKAVRFPRATVAPQFAARRVIASSPWEFVALWLKQNANQRAQIFWDQAQNFFESSSGLPVQAAPLPLYYSFLNAVKALLETKGIAYQNYHGMSGIDLRTATNSRIRIENEGLQIKNGGILPSLISYFGEVEATKRYSFKDVLSNLPFIHRSYSMTYSTKELFLSIERPRYVTDGSGQAWFRADLPKDHTHGQTLRTIPTGFSTAQTPSKRYILKSDDKFAWSGRRRPTGPDINALQTFHQQMRLNIDYISGLTPTWYVKRELAGFKRVERNNLTLIFFAMHRMSEIARYKPFELSRFLAGKRSWLIHEFVRTAQNQFIDEMAGEITGFEISPAGVQQSQYWSPA